MCKYFKQLIIGPKCNNKKLKNTAIKQQYKNLRSVWMDDDETIFGLTRLFRLFIVICPFIFPNLYIRHLSGLGGLLCRKMVIEFQVLVKVLIPLAVLFMGWSNNLFAKCIIVYLLLETVLYLLSLIFLSDIYANPISFKRSVLLLIINYIEITLDFSVLYLGIGQLNITLSPISSIYFSFMTSTTVGFGDFYPTTDLTRMIAVGQSLTIFLFIVLFVNYFVANLSQNIANKNKM